MVQLLLALLSCQAIGVAGKELQHQGIADDRPKAADGGGVGPPERERISEVVFADLRSVDTRSEVTAPKAAGNKTKVDGAEEGGDGVSTTGRPDIQNATTASPVLEPLGVDEEQEEEEEKEEADGGVVVAVVVEAPAEEEKEEEEARREKPAELVAKVEEVAGPGGGILISDLEFLPILNARFREYKTVNLGFEARF